MNLKTTNFTYDANHQLLTVVDPRGNTVVTNTYDSQMRVVTSQRDAKGGQTQYIYDEVNRKTDIVVP
jgi:YD repeat-containing protein